MQVGRARHRRARAGLRSRMLENPRGGFAEVAGVEGIGYAATGGTLLDVPRFNELREGARDGGRAGEEVSGAVVGVEAGGRFLREGGEEPAGRLAERGGDRLVDLKENLRKIS